MDERLTKLLQKMSSLLAEVDVDRDVKGPAPAYGVEMITRLRSTFDSSSMLLTDGRDDEAILLI